MAWLLGFAGTKILIVGDQESDAWRELFHVRSFVEAIKGTNILLAAHHGREIGFSEELYTHFGEDPYLTIVSDGRHCDPSATDRYSQHSRGWAVTSRSTNVSKIRKCLTTYSDGVICVECHAGADVKNYLGVSVK